MAKRRKNNNRRRTRRILNLVLLLLVLTGVFLTLTFCFKCEQITVQGDSIYSDEQVIEATGIRTGRSLFWYLTSICENRVWRTLPYLESVQITRRLPHEFVITLEPASEYAAVPCGNEYYILSSSLKIVDIRTDLAGMPVIVGLEPNAAQVGEYLTADNEIAVASTKTLMQALYNESLLGSVTLLDVTNSIDLRFVYENRIVAYLGTSESLEYKLAMFCEVVVNREQADFAGTVDLSKSGEALVSDDAAAVSGIYSEYLQN